MSRDYNHKSNYLLALFLLASCASAQQPSGSTDYATATVLKVIDGDTIVLKLQNQTETVRLLGVDTPETVHPTKDVECFGPEASVFAKSTLKKGAIVKLVRDIEPRDRFQRLLAYLYLADGTFFNQLLIEQGFAKALSIEPNMAFAAQFANLESSARDRRVGLWHSCER
ncbi:MAG: thermonuclease family protein [Actinobacteria bacterium]|nr:thermonuclease family protein [Actinomycetota bacterium]MDA3017460.1 thermonuclease family protein [Actinomycetota bacterium]